MAPPEADGGVAITTYYVSSAGSDANNGLGPNAAHASNKPWLTLGKALGAAGISSGDTVYLAPGSYRETVSVAMTSATVETQVLGDPGNAQGFKDGSGVLLDAGRVIWTAYTTNDTTAPAATATLTLANRDYLTFQHLVFVGGSASIATITGASAASHHITFRDCAIISGSSNAAVQWDSTAGEASEWTFDRCALIGVGNLIVPRLTRPSGADLDNNIVIQNCLFVSPGTAINGLLLGANANNPGGIKVWNCTFVGPTTVLATATNYSTSIPCTIYNSLLLAIRSTALSAATSGQIVEDWNVINAATPRANVSTGTNSVTGVPPATALLVGLGLESLWGLLPRPFLTPLSSSPLLAFGQQAGGPNVDLLSRPRPAGGGGTAYAVGALERHDTAVTESTVITGTKLVGPGDQDLLVPVEATPTVISIKSYYTSNHGTASPPQVRLLAQGELGVNAATVTAGTVAATHETLTFGTITPTSPGWVTLRLVNRGTAAAGTAAFGTVALS